MNCDGIQELIPRYLEDDVFDDERRTVETHLASCACCRESVETFTALERALKEIGAAVPSWKKAQARFALSYGLGRRRSVARLFFNAPFLAGLSFIAFGVVFFVRGNSVLLALPSLIERLAVCFGNFEQLLTHAFAAFAGMDPNALISIYGSVVVVLLGSSGLLVLKYAKRQ